MDLELDDALVASINELVDTFRDSLLALVPFADRAKLNWSDTDTHDSWERLAVGLFDTFVRGPVGSDRTRGINDFSLARYDIDSIDLSRNSWIGVQSGTGPNYVFVRFLSRVTAFDTVQAASVDMTNYEVGERFLFEIDDVNFFLVRRSEGVKTFLLGVEVND